MRPIYIVDGIRTAIGNFGGSLSSIRVDDLGAIVIAELMKRNSSVDPHAIADVLMGCANQAGEDNRNVARMSALMAGLPWSVPGETINRLCSSGMAATIHGARMLALGDGELAISGGMENMTRGPWVMSKASKPFGRDVEMHDSSFGWRFINPKLEQLYGVDGMGQTAENLVDKYGISREDQDAFALWSQTKAFQAQTNGRLAKEIVEVRIPQRKKEDLIFTEDQFIKGHSTIEKLSTLRAAFRKDGTVTAGNASGLNDGAAALLLSSEDGLNTYGLEPKARIVSNAVVGVEPRIMGIGPVYAAELALKRAGLTLADMDIIELNEAFAAQALACTRAWGIEDTDPRINPNGGAIALGHPLGVTGARILQTATLELHQQNKRYALCTLCVGVGQGYATVIERI